MAQVIWSVENGDGQGAYAEQVEQVLLQGVTQANTIVAVRYYELALMIA